MASSEKWKSVLQARMAPGENIGSDVFAKIWHLGLPLPQFIYGFKTALPGRNRVGGIVECIRNWEGLTAHIQWPACYECEDNGIVDDSQSPFNQKAPCLCEAGRRVQKTKFPAWELRLKAQSEGKVFCALCAGTGRPTRRDCSTDWELNDGEPFCKCSTGMAQYNDFKGQLRAEQERRRSLEEKGICPDCNAKNASDCRFCSGTGRYYSQQQLKAADLCRNCFGTKEQRSIHGQKVGCRICMGTGKWTAR